MSFYALQVITGHESRFLSLTDRLAAERGFQFLWPRRSLRIRRGGRWHEALAPIFPSYLFLQADRVDPAFHFEVRRVPGFVRFLPANDNVRPLESKDERLLKHFLSFGEIVHKSQAYFDENKRIRITSGPLKDLEGLIVKVDKRKGRARVRLELYADSFEVDFGFEAMEAVLKKEGS